jgi:serine/threonine-protein kinase
MTDPTLIDDLLDRWERLRGEGQSLTPEEICQDHPELLETIRSRLAALRGVDDLLETEDEGWGTTLSFDAGPESAGPATESAPLPETSGARYRPRSFHARGNLGEVFLAIDAEVHRPVALKFIQRRIAVDPAALRRFRLEAEITGRLEHPGIVPVYGVVEADDGRPCYAMRFVRGETLRDRIAALHADRPSDGDADAVPRALALARLLRRFVHVCQTVGYAHSRDVVHRDLKPANILLGAFDETLVVDWGLAKCLAEPTGTGTPLDDADLLGLDAGPLRARSDGDVRTESMVGTPAYMSPEQADPARRHEVGHASDVYALGACLFSILTGRTAVKGSADLGEFLGRVQRGEIAAPRDLSPTVPKPLDAITRKAMALRIEDRYPTAQALAEDLERWLADEPVSAHREPLIARVRRWGRRHRTLVTTAAASLLVGLAGLGAIASLLAIKNGQLDNKNIELGLLNARLVQSNRELDQQRERAETREAQAIEAVRRFRDAVTEEPALLDSPELEDLRNRLLKEPFAFFKTLSDQLRASGDTREESLASLARAVSELGELGLLVGDRAEAIESLRESAKLWEQLAQAHPEGPSYEANLAKLSNNLGQGLSEQGREDEAEATLRRSIELQEKLAREHPDAIEHEVEAAKARNNLGTLLRTRRELDEAESLYRDTLARLGPLAAANPEVIGYQSTLAASNDGLASLLTTRRRLPDARAAYERSIEISDRLLREHPDDEHRESLASGLHNLGILLRAMNLPGESEASFRRAIEQREELLRRHPSRTRYQTGLALSLNALANLFTSSGRTDEAIATYRKALVTREDLARKYPNDREHQDTLASTHSNLGVVLRRARQPEEARASYQRAIAIRERLVREQPGVAQYQDGFALNLSNLGNLERDAGRLDEAEKSHRRALEIRENLAREHPADPRHQPELADSHNNLGVLLKARERPEEAEAAYRRAIAIRERLVREQPRVAEVQNKLAQSYANLANLLGTSGRLAEAEAACRQSIETYERLIQGHPGVARYRNELIGRYETLVQLLRDAGRPEEAKTVEDQIEQMSKPKREGGP